MFLPRFFFDDNAGEGGGASGEIENPVPAKSVQLNDVGDKVTINEPQVFTPELQQELNELRALKKSIAEREPTKTEAEIAKEAEVAQANFRKYAVENDIMKNDDFTKYETIKQKQDRELVYDNWLTSWKEENPDVEESEVENLAKFDFENEYGLNSDNEKKLARAQAKLKKEAGEIRTPTETLYTTAKERYEAEDSIRKTYPAFQKYLTDKIIENLPDSYKVFEKDIDGEKIPLTIDLSADEKKEILAEIEKQLSIREAYDLFMKETKDGKNEMIDALVAKETKYLINEKKQEALLEQAAEKFMKVGKLKGSNVGATQPFAMVKQGGIPATVVKMDAQQAINKSQQEVRAKMNNGR